MRLSRWLAGADGSLPVRRMRQQRLSGLPLGDQRTAMAVGHGDKAPGHVIAEERDRRRVPAVAHRQRAAGTGGVRRVAIPSAAIPV
jgi:hypothetical protein